MIPCLESSFGSFVYVPFDLPAISFFHFLTKKSALVTEGLAI